MTACAAVLVTAAAHNCHARSPELEQMSGNAHGSDLVFLIGLYVLQSGFAC